MNIELDFNFTHIFKGVHKENFSLACQHELLLEKQALKNRRSEDKMVELIQVIFLESSSILLVLWIKIHHHI